MHAKNPYSPPPWGSVKEFGEILGPPNNRRRRRKTFATNPYLSPPWERSATLRVLKSTILGAAHCAVCLADSSHPRKRLNAV